MIRQAPRILRSSQNTLRTTPIRRLVSTAPPARKRRSFKSLGIRLGLVIGAIGYYNNSELFAEEPHCILTLPPRPPHPESEADQPQSPFHRPKNQPKKPPSQLSSPSPNKNVSAAYHPAHLLLKLNHLLPSHLPIPTLTNPPTPSPSPNRKPLKKAPTMKKPGR